MPAPVASGVAEPRGTVFSGTLSICNTLLGSGMLAMPFAIASVGLGVGLGLILCSGLASALGLWLLTNAARHVPGSDTSAADAAPGHARAPASFFELSKLTYPNAAVLFDSAIAIKCFGVASSYLIVIADLMPEVVAGFGGNAQGILGSRLLWIGASFAEIMPLSYARQLSALRHTSMVALAAVFYLVFLVIYFFWSPNYPIAPGEIRFARFDDITGFFRALPIFVFAFTCHQNIFAVYNEIRDNSGQHMNVVISTSVCVALIVYYIIGPLGYLMYGESVVGNIIRMYPVIPLVTFGRLALAILFMVTYPVQVHPCRTSLTKIIHHLRDHQDSASPAERRPLNLSVSPSYASVEQDDPRLVLAGRSAVRETPAEHVERSVLLPTTTDPEGVQSGLSLDQDLPTSPRKPIVSSTGRADALHYILTSSILALSLAVAMSIRSLDKILAVVGATGSTTICYILPGLFYYKLYANKPWTWVKGAAVGLATTGFLIMIICLTMTLIPANNKSAAAAH